MHTEKQPDIEQIYLFPTKLYKYSLPTDLVDKCREELIKYANENESGIPWYFSTYNTELETTHNVGPFSSLVNANVERIATSIVKKRVLIENSFFNYVPKGCWHPKHNHGDDSMLCAIVYFDNMGHTNFYDPRPQLFNHEPYMENAEKGKVVFFSGWLEHEMPPHNEDEYRITMPFNMTIK